MGTANAAQHWADHRKLLEKFAIVRDYLDKGEHVVVDELLVPIDQPDWCPENPCLILQNNLPGIKETTRRLILPGIMRERVKTQTLWTPLQMNNLKISGEVTQSSVVLMNTR
jgi:hypothetical protein